MSESINASVVEARIEFVEQQFARPLVLSSGTIRVVTQAIARVRVQIGGRESEGLGSIYFSTLWAWPDPELSHDFRDAAMRRYAEDMARDLPEIAGGPSHPLAIGMRIHGHARRPDTQLPLLARIVASSPFDAAIHDAVGRALGVNAMQLYEHDQPLDEVDHLFAGRNALAAVRATLCRPPRARCPAWWIVGKDDDLPRDLPRTINANGYQAFKIKTLGKSAVDDAARTSEIYRVAREAGVAEPRLAIDSNCGNPDAESVAAYLDVLLELNPQAYAAVESLEQPTGRNIAAHAFDWHAISARKQVLMDEGLTGIEEMRLAKKQGWSGLALKTCKGHSLMLVAAAWARENGMTFTLQDLTNPGIAAIHSAVLAAHLPTTNGVELNSPQFTPAANLEASERYAGLFAVRDGMHELAPASALGLGSIA